MKQKTFIKDVIKEIEALKENANKEQKTKLIFATFIPDKPEQCIYGQMTGDCWSLEAAELIEKCNPGLTQVFSFIGDISWLKTYPKKEASKEKRQKYSYITLLEQFIVIEKYKKYNQNILSYIKGTTNILKIKELT